MPKAAIAAAGEDVVATGGEWGNGMGTVKIAAVFSRFPEFISVRVGSEDEGGDDRLCTPLVIIAAAGESAVAAGRGGGINRVGADGIPTLENVWFPKAEGDGKELTNEAPFIDNVEAVAGDAIAKGCRIFEAS